MPISIPWNGFLRPGIGRLSNDDLIPDCAISGAYLHIGHGTSQPVDRSGSHLYSLVIDRRRTQLAYGDDHLLEDKGSLISSFVDIIEDGIASSRSRDSCLSL